MLVSGLDSLRRCECQPTPPMLWLRSDSRLVWHLLGGGCFLSLGGLGGGGGGTGDGRCPRGTAVLPGGHRGRAGSLLFGEGMRPRWAPRQGGLPAAPPQNPPAWPRGQKQQEEQQQQQLQCPPCPQNPPCPDQPGPLLPLSGFFPWEGLRPPEPRGSGRSLCFPARPSLQGTPPPAASSGSTRGAATAARSAPSPPPPATR